MSGKHTPGPWELSGVTPGRVMSYAGRLNPKLIADCESPYQPEENEANARLIVEAPEMLKMLRSRLVADCHCVHCTKTLALIRRVEGGAECAS